jgi:pSer/pThr/pTyr-binding forkhead associated (FHA) protein
MGGNQFEVTMNDKLLMVLKVIEGPNIGHCFMMPKKDKITIGRKPHNEINFPEDHHLSNIHSTFFNVNGTWYIEDLGSTNGTWIRLSSEGVKSQKWNL